MLRICFENDCLFPCLLVQLVAVADSFQVGALKRQCEILCSDRIQLENAVRLYLKARVRREHTFCTHGKVVHTLIVLKWTHSTILCYFFFNSVGQYLYIFTFMIGCILFFNHNQISYCMTCIFIYRYVDVLKSCLVKI